jgi:hypothetical protein
MLRGNDYWAPPEAVERNLTCVSKCPVVSAGDEVNAVSQHEYREESDAESTPGLESASSQSGELRTNMVRSPAATAEIKKAVYEYILVHSDAVVAYLQDPNGLLFV